MIGNQHAEDLRRACDALEAENERLREVLRWNAATLQHAVYGQRRLYASDKITIIAADGKTQTIEQILDAADAALAQEQGESDAQGH